MGQEDRAGELRAREWSTQGVGVDTGSEAVFGHTRFDVDGPPNIIVDQFGGTLATLLDQFPEIVAQSFFQVG